MTLYSNRNFSILQYISVFHYFDDASIFQKRKNVAQLQSMIAEAEQLIISNIQTALLTPDIFLGVIAEQNLMSIQLQFNRIIHMTYEVDQGQLFLLDRSVHPSILHQEKNGYGLIAAGAVYPLGTLSSSDILLVPAGMRDGHLFGVLWKDCIVIIPAGCVL